jgi:hypothetical protein
MGFFDNLVGKSEEEEQPEEVEEQKEEEEDTMEEDADFIAVGPKEGASVQQFLAMNPELANLIPGLKKE